MTRIRQFLESNVMNYIELAFKMIYIIHLLASFNPFIDGTIVTKVTLPVTMMLGGFVLLCRVLSFRSYLHTPGLLLLIMFVVSFIIPSFFIYRYALVDSTKTVIWMTFQFGILFAFNNKKDSSFVKRELKTVSFVTMLIITAENIASLIMAFTGYFKMYQKLDGTYAVTGLAWWGRLYGVHGDPNYACVYTIAALMIAVYFFIKYRNAWCRLALIAVAAVNFMFISFTASRTGLIALIIATAVFVFTYFIGSAKKKYRVIKSLTAVAIAVVLIFALNKATIKGFNTMKSLLSEEKVTQQQESSEGSVSTDDKTEDTEEKAPVIGRTEEELNGDITNRRGEIWGSGFEIFSKNPVLGIGFENVIGYSQDKLPSTYIVDNDQTDFDAFHNTLVDVLVSQGAIGILLAGIFAVLFIIYFIKRIGLKYSENREELCTCIAIFISALASAMFLSHIFYVNIATTGVFWLFAGYLGHLLYTEK